MTFNRMKYKRTADVDSLTYYGIPELSLDYLSSYNDEHEIKNQQDSKSPVWSYIELIDFSGDSQTMRHGDKLNMFHLFSLVYHHNAYMNYNVWEKHKERPLIYLNISKIKEQCNFNHKQETICFQTRIIIHRRGKSIITASIMFS